MHCPKCGYNNNNTATVCAGCGASLKSENQIETRPKPGAKATGIALIIGGIIILVWSIYCTINTISIGYGYIYFPFGAIIFIILGVKKKNETIKVMPTVDLSQNDGTVNPSDYLVNYVKTKWINGNVIFDEMWQATNYAIQNISKEADSAARFQGLVDSLQRRMFLLLTSGMSGSDIRKYISEYESQKNASTLTRDKKLIKETSEIAANRIMIIFEALRMIYLASKNTVGFGENNIKTFRTHIDELCSLLEKLEETESVKVAELKHFSSNL